MADAMEIEPATAGGPDNGEAAPMAVDAPKEGSKKAKPTKRFEIKKSASTAASFVDIHKSGGVFTESSRAQVERCGYVELGHLHGHLCHLPQQPVRAQHRVPGQPQTRTKVAAAVCSSHCLRHCRRIPQATPTTQVSVLHGESAVRAWAVLLDNASLRCDLKSCVAGHVFHLDCIQRW